MEAAQLIKHHDIGVKLIPLDEDGKPAILWTPVHEDPNYWTPKTLTQEAYKFKNVATCFGKTCLKDDKGPLYLYALDIDSEEVYNILFRLPKGDSEEFSLIPKMQECSFVTKTRKTSGFHIYWLSHIEHKPILTTDCKPKFEFEIKTDKSLSTLPPSRHRKDPDFRYKNTGQNRLFVADKLYAMYCKLLTNTAPIGCNPVSIYIKLLQIIIRGNTRKQIFGFWNGNGFEVIGMQFDPS